MKKLSQYRKQLVAASLVLLLLGASFFAVRAYLQHRRLVRQKEMVAKMFDPNLSFEERREMGSQFQKDRNNLSEGDRTEIRKEMNGQMKNLGMERIKKYFSLSDSEKTAFLDEEIAKDEKRGEEMRKRFEEWRAQGGGGRGQRGNRGQNNDGGGGGQQGGGDSGGPPTGAPGQGGGGQGAPTMGQGGGGGFGGGPGRNANNSGDRRKTALNWSSSQERQQWGQFYQDYKNRRQQLGYSTSGGGGFGGFGGGGRGGR